MQLLITGIPGSGKTTLAKALGKKLHYRIFSDKLLAKKAHLFRKEEGDLTVDPTRLEKIMKKSLKQHQNGIWEGHLLPEMKLPKRVIWILLEIPSKVLIKRLKKRKYPEWKILDNAWANEDGYLPCQLKKNHSGKVIRVDGTKPIKVLATYIMTQLPKEKKGRMR